MSNTVLDKNSEIFQNVLDKEIFFIVGVPKSGTTWLQRLLDAHPKITCKGEAHFTDIFYFHLSKALDAYNKDVETQGGALAHLKKYGGHVDTLCYDMIDSYYLLALAMGLMFKKWIGTKNIQIIGDKTPDNIRSMTLLSTIFPSSRFIHVIRDGRDCTVSGWFFQISGIDKNKRVTQTFEQYARTFAKIWQTQVNQGRTAGSMLGDRYTEIRYENLVEDPQSGTRRLLQFLGADSSGRLVTDCVSSAEFQLLSNGRRPGDEDTKSFFRKGVVGDWSNHFSRSLTTEFNQIAGETLKRLGYC